MKINKIIHGRFLERPNRFTVVFEYEGDKKGISTENNAFKDLAHLKDPGRLKELLHPGVQLLLRKATPNPKRKTKFDVIAVFKDDLWVLINSGFHSDLAAQLIESGEVDEFKDYEIEKREYTFGNSRLDFLLTLSNESKNVSTPLSDSPNPQPSMLLEVKGCTLVENGLAEFPDAPTLRGKKHLEELIEGKKQGFEAAVLFLIMKEDAKVFSPNYVTDPSFSETLEKAAESGVHIIPFVFKTTFRDDNLTIKPFKKIKTQFKVDK